MFCRNWCFDQTKHRWIKKCKLQQMAHRWFSDPPTPKCNNNKTSRKSGWSFNLKFNLRNVSFKWRWICVILFPVSFQFKGSSVQKDPERAEGLTCVVGNLEVFSFDHFTHLCVKRLHAASPDEPGFSESIWWVVIILQHETFRGETWKKGCFSFYVLLGGLVAVRGRVQVVKRAVGGACRGA